MKEFLRVQKEKFDQNMERATAYFSGAESHIGAACKYTLTSGGKRLRPILCYLGAELMGKDSWHVDHIAIAVECVHNYSLVHDDLPCMDDDSLRHGIPATHVKFGEGMAVLTGDALLNMSAEILLSNALIDDNYIEAMRIFYRHTGIYGMVAGQAIDINNDKGDNTLQDIIKLNELKTAALFKSALVASAVACGANAEQRIALEKYCDKLGLIFQMVDDVLDIESSVEELGKNIGSDIELGKRTYLSIVGIDKTKQDIIKYEREAISTLAIFGESADKLIKLTKFLSRRKR